MCSCVVNILSQPTLMSVSREIDFDPANMNFMTFMFSLSPGISQDPSFSKGSRNADMVRLET